ncbi:GNAT family N-acetyltransferase [Bailinhaonella thermotolerans]|uniref:GNAT family N-acetyltransferase n=1 Tax=Bailinhaonella thermotolerans TaxID=1070861 RepID=A0A3A4A6U8_9ACTN|nr:GNAT family N-acetyltransferase [Bailinhaonella thermotolerans]RJL23661.1 GNAT family N-acetyltransferase [Bailinhaonella thermotolerans]
MTDDPPFLIRPATAADDAALLALDTTAWTPGSGFPSVQTEERTAFFTGQKDPGTHLVAEMDGEIVGVVSVRARSWFPETAHVFDIAGLVVAVSARRLGVASALLSAAERKAAEAGAVKLSLKVLSTNTAAQRLYERHGYTVEGRHPAELLIGGEYVGDLTLGKLLAPVTA